MTRADFMDWARERQLEYQESRRLWRVDHPLGPVEVTEKTACPKLM